MTLIARCAFAAYLLLCQLQQYDCYCHNSFVSSKISTQIPANPSSICFSVKESQVEDDGYSVSGRRNSILKMLGKLNPLNKREPGTLILVRHGQTTMNYNKTFTGWIDVDLSENGKREVEHAARLLLERGYTVDVTYTSRLKRAIRSSWIILKELGIEINVFVNFTTFPCILL